MIPPPPPPSLILVAGIIVIGDPTCLHRFRSSIRFLEADYTTSSIFADRAAPAAPGYARNSSVFRDTPPPPPPPLSFLFLLLRCASKSIYRVMDDCYRGLEWRGVGRWNRRLSRASSFTLSSSRGILLARIAWDDPLDFERSERGVIGGG